MKILARTLAILVIAVSSVVLAQRLTRKLYADMGRKYIAVEERKGA